MKYYVNRLNEESDYHTTAIGLFKFNNGHHWEGEGNFCGWYGAESYTNVILLGYYTIPADSIYEPKGKKHIKEIDLLDEFDIRDRIYIGSIIWEKVFEENNDYKALQRFFKEDF